MDIECSDRYSQDNKIDGFHSDGEEKVEINRSGKKLGVI